MKFTISIGDSKLLSREEFFKKQQEALEARRAKGERRRVDGSKDDNEEDADEEDEDVLQELQRHFSLLRSRVSCCPSSYWITCVLLSAL